MKTDIAPGTWVRYRYRNDIEYAQVIVRDSKYYIAICGYPPEDTFVQPCVWKGRGENETLLARGKPVKFKRP